MANKCDVFSDVIRVHEDYRKDDKDGDDIDGGTVCVVMIKETNGRIYAILRGLGDDKIENGKNIIRIDDNLRKRLNVVPGSSYEFIFRKANWLETFIWAFNASDTGYKISARIALVSFVVTVFISILPIFRAIATAMKYFCEIVF